MAAGDLSEKICKMMLVFSEKGLYSQAATPAMDVRASESTIESQFTIIILQHNLLSNLHLLQNKENILIQVLKNFSFFFIHFFSTV